MKKVKQGSIAPALREMEVGDKLSYPMSRYTSVQNTLVRVRRDYPERTYTSSYKTGELEVIRQK